jgi:putative ABC transport system permease protein
LLYRTVMHERSRVILSTLTVGAAVGLVLVFEGFRVGLYAQVRAFPAELPADLVAIQAGVSNVLGARSVLPQSARAAVEAVAGVKVAHPLGGLPLIYTRGERRSPVYVVAYDSAGGPRHLVAGHQITAPDQIVADVALARQYGLGPGDGVDFLGHGFTIAGLSGDGTNFFNPYVFVRLEDMIDLFLAGDLPEDVATGAALSFLLIELEPGSDRAAVRADIERKVASVDVFTPAELAANDVRRAQGFMGPPLDLLVAIAYIIAVLVVALTLYGAVLARLREFAIMKAIGARAGWLGRRVLVDALVTSAIAFPVGIVLAAGFARLVGMGMPMYRVQPLDILVLLRTAVAMTATACLGGWLPIRMVADVDPALVFRRGE